MSILVCPLSRASELARKRRPSRTISLLDPGTPFPDFDHLGEEHRLRLEVFDVEQELEGLASPGVAHVETIVEFVSGWDRSGPLLVHCYAGVSRSSATAFIAACVHNPHAEELVIARALREASAMASPNRRIVTLADAVLGRGGRMVDAVFAIGRGGGWQGSDNEPFTLASQYPEGEG